MSIFDIEPYRDQVKPMMFAPRIDTRSKKNIEIPEQYNKVSKEVEEEVNQFSKKRKSKKGSDKELLNKNGQNVKPEESANEGRKIRSYRTMSKIYEGLSLLPQDILARADQIQSKANFERVKEDSYIYFADVINSSFIEDKKRKELEEEIFEDSFFKMAEELPGQGNTSPHNLNIFHGIDTNLFKKKDKSFEVFQKNPYYSALHTNSMTPRNIIEKLDPGFWNNINNGIDHIQKTKLSELPTKYIKDLKNPYGKHTNDSLNWTDAPDPYTDNKIETFDINANFHTIITSQAWKEWDKSETFNFVNRLWEARSRVDDVLREIVGKAKHFPLVTFKEKETDKSISLKNLSDEETERPSEEVEYAIKELTDSGSVQIGEEFIEKDELTEADALLAKSNTEKENTLLTNVKQWWENIGESLDEAEVLPFGLLTTLTPLMQTMMDWGNWGEEIAQETEAQLAQDEQTDTEKPQISFKEKMIQDYLEHTTTEYIQTKFKSNHEIVPASFGSNSIEQNKNIFNQLLAQGLIDSRGQVTELFNPKDPEFSLNLGLSQDDERKVSTILRESSIGSFSLQNQDNTKVNNRKRNNIQLKCSDNQYRTLPDLLDMMLEGDSSSYNQVQNSLVVYDTLFDLHATMTQLTHTGSTTGKIENNSTGRNIKVKVSENSKWEEWERIEGQSVSVGKWAQKEGDYEMEFETYEQAEIFKDKIRGLIAILEPIVGTFSPEIKDQKEHPVRILIDNSGSHESIDMITDNHENYRIEVDHLFNKHYFKTDSWKEVSSYLSSQVFDTMKHGIFTRTTFNRMLRFRHKRQVNEYNKKKKEHEEKEIQRIIRELRRYFKQRAKTKKQRKKVEQAAKKRQKEILVAEKRRRIENKKRRERAAKGKRKKS